MNQFAMIVARLSDFLVIVFSLLAAFYWFRSSKVVVPSHPNPNASPAVKNANSFRMIQEISDAMALQSKLSSYGAVAAGVAALLTGVSVVLRLYFV